MARSLFLIVILSVFALYACQVQNFVEVQGNRYATLDDTPATRSAISSQSTAIAMPAGWTLASNDAVTLSAAAANVWGTDCLVLRDGSPVPSSTGATCSASQLVNDGTGRFRPVQSRIFISQPTTVVANSVGKIESTAFTSLICVGVAIFVAYARQEQAY